MELDKTVLLIYYWLKEHQLSKTCACLVQEYGKTVLEQEKPSCSLKHILDSLSTLIDSLSKWEEAPSTIVHLDGGYAAGSHGQSKKRKLSPKVESIGESADNLSDKSNATINTQVKKKLKIPLVPPGQWVCPEMEKTLYDVFERCLPIIESLKKEEEVLHEISSETVACTMDQPTVKMFTSDITNDLNHDFPKPNTSSELASIIIDKSTNIEKTDINGVVKKPEIQVKEKKKKKLLMSVTPPELFCGDEPHVSSVENDTEKSLEGEEREDKELKKKKKKKRKRECHIDEEVTEHCPELSCSDEPRVGMQKNEIRTFEKTLEEGGEHNAFESSKVKKKKKKKKSVLIDEDIISEKDAKVITSAEKEGKEKQNTDFQRIPVCSVSDETGECIQVKKKKKKKEKTSGMDNMQKITSNNVTNNELETTPSRTKKKKSLEGAYTEKEQTPYIADSPIKKSKFGHTNTLVENEMALFNISTVKKKKNNKISYGQ